MKIFVELNIINQKLTARLRQAKLIQNPNIEDVDYQIPRGFDKSSILSFSQCKWISEIGKISLKLLKIATGSPSNRGKY